MRRLILTFLLLYSPFAVAEEPPPTPEAPAESGASEDTLLQAADEIAQKVGEIRGLPVKTPVKRGIKSGRNSARF